MSVNIGGIIAVSVFYLIVLAMGIWASWKEKKRGKNTTDSVVLAGRNIGVTLGTLTLIGIHFQIINSSLHFLLITKCCLCSDMGGDKCLHGIVRKSLLKRSPLVSGSYRFRIVTRFR